VQNVVGSLFVVRCSWFVNPGHRPIHSHRRTLTTNEQRSTNTRSLKT